MRLRYWFHVARTKGTALWLLFYSELYSKHFEFSVSSFTVCFGLRFFALNSGVWTVTYGHSPHLRFPVCHLISSCHCFHVQYIIIRARPSVPLMPPLWNLLFHIASCVLFCPPGFYLHTTFHSVWLGTGHVTSSLIGKEYEACLELSTICFWQKKHVFYAKH